MQCKVILGARTIQSVRQIGIGLLVFMTGIPRFSHFFLKMLNFNTRKIILIRFIFKFVLNATLS